MGHSIARMRKRLEKKARRGFRGYPLATLAFYGPDDRRASKVVASIMEDGNDEAVRMRKWHSEEADVRHDAEIVAEVMAFIEEFGVLSVAMPDRIVNRHSILTLNRRAKLTSLSGTAEVVPVANRGDPRGFV